MKVALLLAAALALAGAAVALALERADEAPPAARDASSHAMEADARCAHMPEHCARGGAARG